MGYKHFTKDDRNELAILLKKGYDQKDIADVLGKHSSSIGREIKNNSVNGEYDPNKANHKAYVKRLKSKYQCMKIEKNNELRQYIQKHLDEDKWTPEEIAGRLKNKDKLFNEATGEQITISFPVIYKWTYSSFGQYYCQFLKTKRHKRKKQTGKAKNKFCNLPNRVSVHERPVVAHKFGHLEGDVLGSIKSDTEVVAGIREKLSRFIMIVKVPRLKYAVDGFKEILKPHHKIFKTLTLDNGVENNRYEELDIDTYFCDPYSSWQKGGIENDFQRLRRFIPKKDTLDNHSNEDIAQYAELMNNTPRKCLNWNTPKEVFNELANLQTNSNNLLSCT